MFIKSPFYLLALCVLLLCSCGGGPSDGPLSKLKTELKKAKAIAVAKEKELKALQEKLKNATTKPVTSPPATGHLFSEGSSGALPGPYPWRAVNPYNDLYLDYYMYNEENGSWWAYQQREKELKDQIKKERSAGVPDDLLLTPPNADLTFSEAEDPKLTTLLPVCERTPQVQHAILKKLEKTDCAKVTAGDLKTIVTLNLNPEVTEQPKIETLKAGDFSGMVNLALLDIREHLIRYLPDDVFQDQGQLEWLILRHGFLNGFTTQDFKPLKNLKYLDLTRNLIFKVPVDCFQHLKNLIFIGLGNNYIYKIQPETFRGLNNLVALDLSYNELDILPATFLKGLTSLERFLISRNHFESLPLDLFADTLSIKYIMLEHNRLSTFSPSLVKHLPNLKSLWLGENRLSQSEKNNIFKHLPFKVKSL